MKKIHIRYKGLGCTCEKIIWLESLGLKTFDLNIREIMDLQILYDGNCKLCKGSNGTTEDISNTVILTTYNNVCFFQVIKKDIDLNKHILSFEFEAIIDINMLEEFIDLEKKL